MTVWLKLGDAGQYELTGSLHKINLRDLITVQEATGLTLDRYEQCMRDIFSGQNKTIAELLPTAEHVKALAVHVWGMRRAAGENIGVWEAVEVPLEEWEFIDDSPEPEESPDPTEPPTGSGEDESSDQLPESSSTSE